MDPALLDSDILSDVFKQRNPLVSQHGQQYVRSHGQFAFSAVTRFEIIRGYEEQSSSQLAGFLGRRAARGIAMRRGVLRVVAHAAIGYTIGMETIVRNVRDLSDTERSVAERLVGQKLGQNQQLVIKVVAADAAPAENGSAADTEPMPWDNFYEGLSEEQIDAIEASISRRLDLTRDKPFCP